MLSGHPLRGVWYRPPAGIPDLVRTISRPLPTRGSAPPYRADDFEAAPDEGAIPLSFYCPAERDAIVVLLPASPDLGEVISGPSRRSDQKGAPSEPQRLAQNRLQPRTFGGR